MWICPHKAFDHQSVRDFTCSAGPGCGDRTHEVYVNLDGVTIERPVLRIADWGLEVRRRLDQKMVRYEEIKAAMKIRDVRICPHLKMSDKMVYGAAAAGSQGAPFFQVGIRRRMWGKWRRKCWR